MSGPGFAWRPDVLGAPYEALTLPMAADHEGEVVATLVRRAEDGPADDRRPAVLHVHGFADYFFQIDLAEWWAARGYAFYALDLRKYGRSWLPHQTPTYVADLADYAEDLDAAHAVLTASHDRIVLSAHSTGGLTVPLWASRRRPAGVVAMALNSPWLDLNSSWLNRVPVTKVVDLLGPLDPMRVITRTVTGTYVRSLHTDYDGEWTFDLRWKPVTSFPARIGWLRAVRRGQARVHRGIDVGVPVLVLSSDRTTPGERMGPDVFASDIVLDVDQIRRRSVGLGRHVTLVQVAGAMHDVYLSREPARARAYDELDRWLRAYIERPARGLARDPVSDPVSDPASAPVS